MCGSRFLRVNGVLNDNIDDNGCKIRKNSRNFGRILESSAKIKVGLRVSSVLWREFRELAFAKYGCTYGCLSLELEEALKNWLSLHTQKHTETRPISSTHTPVLLNCMSRVSHSKV
ncbi:MAG: hypothetical protein QXD52_05780 [Candidatus Bathyarchaeia archaeon]